MRTWNREFLVSLFTAGAIFLLYGFAVAKFSHHLKIRPENDASISKQSVISDNDISDVLSPQDHTSRPPTSTNVIWNITKGFRRPDGVLKEVYLINNQFPGPTIEARPGDELNITVRNLLPANETSDVSIHWHGLQLEDNSVDGVPGVTQCAIRPKKSFTYHIQLSERQTGTFWYHSHSSHQRADGLYGALIVHDPNTSKRDYQDDRTLLIGDWYHRSGAEIYNYYNDWKNFKIEPVGDSIVLSGRGHFNCSSAVPARPVDCVLRKVPHLRLRETRTRLRLINVGSLLGYTISIPGYNMKIIEVDGGNSVMDLDAREGLTLLYPGERVDVILERTRHGIQDTSLVVALDRGAMRFPNLALTRTQRFPVIDESVATTPEMSSVSTDIPIDLDELSGPRLEPGVMPISADKTILLYTKVAYLGEFENRPKGQINRTTWQTPDYPLLGLDESPLTKSPSILTVMEGSWVDLAINNLDDVPHPFHLHGYSFYVLQTHAHSRSSAYEAFNPFDGTKEPAGGPMNLESPRQKDTIVVPPMGYAVLRFHATTVGFWLLHCHVSLHEAVGMALVLHVKSESNLAPAEIMKEKVQRGCTLQSS